MRTAHVVTFLFALMARAPPTRGESIDADTIVGLQSPVVKDPTDEAFFELLASVNGTETARLRETTPHKLSSRRSHPRKRGHRSKQHHQRAKSKADFGWTSDVTKRRDGVLDFGQYIKIITNIYGIFKNPCEKSEYAKYYTNMLNNAMGFINRHKEDTMFYDDRNLEGLDYEKLVKLFVSVQQYIAKTKGLQRNINELVSKCDPDKRRIENLNRVNNIVGAAGSIASGVFPIVGLVTTLFTTVAKYAISSTVFQQALTKVWTLDGEPKERALRLYRAAGLVLESTRMMEARVLFIDEFYRDTVFTASEEMLDKCSCANVFKRNPGGKIVTSDVKCFDCLCKEKPEDEQCKVTGVRTWDTRILPLEEAELATYQAINMILQNNDKKEMDKGKKGWAAWFTEKDVWPDKDEEEIDAVKTWFNWDIGQKKNYYKSLLEYLTHHSAAEDPEIDAVCNADPENPIEGAEKKSLEELIACVADIAECTIAEFKGCFAVVEDCEDNIWPFDDTCEITRKSLSSVKYLAEEGIVQPQIILTAMGLEYQELLELVHAMYKD